MAKVKTLAIKRYKKMADGGWPDDPNNNSGPLQSNQNSSDVDPSALKAVKSIGNFDTSYSGTVPTVAPTPSMRSIINGAYSADPTGGTIARIPGSYATPSADPGMMKSLAPNIAAPPMPDPSNKPTFADNVNTIGNKIAPYISNITNAFRTPPRPSQPIMDPYVTLAKSNLTGERNQSLVDEHTYDRSVNNNVQGNTGEALKLYNKGRGFTERSAINQRENENNIGITNMQARLDTDINVRNTDKRNDFLKENTARDIAEQRTQSENVANAGDKAVEIRDENEKARVNLAQANVLASEFKNSGVLDRARAYMKKQGLEDPLGKQYKDLDTPQMSMGGRIKRIPSRQTPIYA